jgi:hypothetical protein
MLRSKSKSVGKKEKIEDPKIIKAEFLEDGEMFEDEEKFWEEMNGIKKKKMEVEVEEKINEEEKKMEMEEKKEEEKEEEKTKKKHCLNLYNKYKRKREGEDTGD